MDFVGNHFPQVGFHVARRCAFALRARSRGAVGSWARRGIAGVGLAASFQPCYKALFADALRRESMKAGQSGAFWRVDFQVAVEDVPRCGSLRHLLHVHEADPLQGGDGLEGFYVERYGGAALSFRPFRVEQGEHGGGRIQMHGMQEEIFGGSFRQAIQVDLGQEVVASFKDPPLRLHERSVEDVHAGGQAIGFFEVDLAPRLPLQTIDGKPSFPLGGVEANLALEVLAPFARRGAGTERTALCEHCKVLLATFYGDANIAVKVFRRRDRLQEKNVFQPRGARVHLLRFQEAVNHVEEAHSGHDPHTVDPVVRDDGVVSSDDGAKLQLHRLFHALFHRASRDGCSFPWLAAWHCKTYCYYI